MKVTVALPTRNGGAQLEELLDALHRQRHPYGEIELLAADCASSDSTRQRVEAAGGRILEVDPADFDHGSTRDLLVETAGGEAVVLMSQDAVPAHENWLEALVCELDDDRVAGAYCRQLPRPDCPVLAARALQQSLVGTEQRRVVSLAAIEDLEAMDAWERMRLGAFDNVCSVVRRAVARALPFGPRRFAEDIYWAERALDAGHTLIYTPSARVVHSHRRPISYEYRRTYLAHYALYDLYGLMTAPNKRTAWRSLLESGESMAYALAHEPDALQKLTAAARAPLERFATAWAQMAGARDAAAGRPAHHYRGI